MSQYLFLGKNPESPGERKRLVEQELAMRDYYEQLELTGIQRRVIEFLTSQKGYTRDDLEIHKEFPVDLCGTVFGVKADIVVRVGGRRFLVVKCVMSSPESWERHSIAFCRVVDSYQIPYAVITDGEQARLIDAIHGEVISEGIDAVPSRAEADTEVKEISFEPCPEEKCARERRILYAFDAIKCPVEPSESPEI